MYFPYLRGKQFELIALRELASLLAEKKMIHPIIEPVKKADSGLIRVCNDLSTSGIPFTIIVNPRVGEAKGLSNELLELVNNQLNPGSLKYLGIIIEEGTNIPAMLKKIEPLNITFDGFNLIHLRPLKDLSILTGFDRFRPRKFNVIDFLGTNRRYDRNFSKDTVVTLSDPFILQSKNADYSATPDEPFTSENLYFREDHYYGFSDYLTIGEPYSTSGFLPYAVAIHITYQDSAGSIRIRHFVSDSNEDSSDVAGKFAEALQKLINWLAKATLNTTATREFRRLYGEKHFPGLGTIKKLSIMNHIELINSIL